MTDAKKDESDPLRLPESERRKPHPWNRPPLDKWTIVGMAHYNLNGVRHLFVSMARGAHLIKAEHQSEEIAFFLLAEQAEAIDAAEEEFEDARVAGVIADLRQRLEHAEDRLHFAEDFYAVRYAALDRWVREELTPEQQKYYFNVQANGTGSSREPPSYAQKLSSSTWRAREAEKQLKQAGRKAIHVTAALGGLFESLIHHPDRDPKLMIEKTKKEIMGELTDLMALAEPFGPERKRDNSSAPDDDR